MKNILSLLILISMSISLSAQKADKWMGTCNNGYIVIKSFNTGAVLYAGDFTVKNNSINGTYSLSDYVAGSDAAMQLIANCAGSSGSGGSDCTTCPAGPEGPQGVQGIQGVQGEAGPEGPVGDPGINCWDLNANGVGDVESEDTNEDGVVDVGDCKDCDAGTFGPATNFTTETTFGSTIQFTDANGVVQDLTFEFPFSDICGMCGDVVDPELPRTEAAFLGADLNSPTQFVGIELTKPDGSPAPDGEFVQVILTHVNGDQLTYDYCVGDMAQQGTSDDGGEDIQLVFPTNSQITTGDTLFIDKEYLADYWGHNTATSAGDVDVQYVLGGSGNGCLGSQCPDASVDNVSATLCTYFIQRFDQNALFWDQIDNGDGSFSYSSFPDNGSLVYADECIKTDRALCNGAAGDPDPNDGIGTVNIFHMAGSANPNVNDFLYVISVNGATLGTPELIIDSFGSNNFLASLDLFTAVNTSGIGPAAYNIQIYNGLGPDGDMDQCFNRADSFTEFASCTIFDSVRISTEDPDCQAEFDFVTVTTRAY